MQDVPTASKANVAQDPQATTSESPAKPKRTEFTDRAAAAFVSPKPEKAAPWENNLRGLFNSNKKGANS